MLRVYSIFDRKLREFQGLMTEKNDETLRRSMLSVRGSGHIIEKHPEDFDVVFVGEFDDDTGVLSVAPVVLIANLRELLEAANAER